MTPSEPIQVSIISACRNEMGHIEEFLKSILAQDFGPWTWEAIIADGDSTDGTREFLERYCEGFPAIRVIANPERIVSTGLNRAILDARGKFILRLDAHTYYAPDYCLKCLETLLSTGADNVGGPARTKAEGTLPRAIAAAYHSRFSTGGARFHDQTYEGWVDTVTYGCWRKETLERIGMFDENLVRNQDDELNLRLLRGGGKIWQNPEIVSWYCPRTTLWGLYAQYFQYGFWKVMVIRKHRLPGSLRHLVPASFVIVNLVLLALSLAALVSGAKILGWAVVAWLLLFGSYALASVTASIAAARKSDWSTLPYLPLVFSAYHFSYGFGFLSGLLWQVNGPRTRMSKNSVFVRVTR